jgi:hypothetical protein
MAVALADAARPSVFPKARALVQATSLPGAYWLSNQSRRRLR